MYPHTPACSRSRLRRRSPLLSRRSPASARRPAPSAHTPVPPPTNPSSVPLPPLAPATVDAAAVKALAGKRGISLAAAKTQLIRERNLGARGAQLAKSLAGRSGGSYLDADGKLVVTTLDSAASKVVTGGDARASASTTATARLQGIVDQLDTQAAKGGAGASPGLVRRRAVQHRGGHRDARARTTRPRSRSRRLARSFGDSVRIEQKPASQAPRPAADWLVGGLRVPAAGRPVRLLGRVQHPRRRRTATSCSPPATARRSAGTVSRSGLHHRRDALVVLPDRRLRHVLELLRLVLAAVALGLPLQRHLRPRGRLVGRAAGGRHGLQERPHHRLHVRADHRAEPDRDLHGRPGAQRPRPVTTRASSPATAVAPTSAPATTRSA